MSTPHLASEPILATLVVRRWRYAFCAAVVGAGLVAAGLLWWLDPCRQTIFLCTLHTLTGWYCVGCGATRATHELLHGRVLSALSYNALWVLTLPPLVVLGGQSLWRIVRGRALPEMVSRPGLYLAYLALAVVFMALRNLPWYPLVLLAPPG